MEERNYADRLAMSSAVVTMRTSTFWIGLFAACYVAVLPMANTIAFRNVALSALILSLAWQHLKVHPSFKWPLPVLLWAVYLCLFPLISDSSVTAIGSLFGQWGRGLVAMLVGAGVASIFYRKNRGAAFYLGLVSAFSILVHLYLFSVKAWATSSIPWGYWGRETHHADLGYAAGQAVILLAAAAAANKAVLRPLVVVLITACLLSTALAESRAGLAFSLTGGVLAFGTAYLVRKTHRRLYLLGWLAGIVIVGGIVVMLAIRVDPRWQTMTASLLSGFYGDPVKIQCEGTSSIEPLIIAKYGAGDVANRVIASVRGADGARVVLMRAGLALALKHPWGSDGSRQAFQELLRKECANPMISMAHTHNGWLDTMLALGWVGAALYMWVLFHFFKLGFSSLRRGKTLNEWALVLVALSAFWILRGFTDSVLRDHMLEMQGFVLAYAAVALRLQTRSQQQSDTAQTASQATSGAG